MDEDIDYNPILPTDEWHIRGTNDHIVWVEYDGVKRGIRSQSNWYLLFAFPGVKNE